MKRYNYFDIIVVATNVHTAYVAILEKRAAAATRNRRAIRARVPLAYIQKYIITIAARTRTLGGVVLQRPHFGLRVRETCASYGADSRGNRRGKAVRRGIYTARFECLRETDFVRFPDVTYPVGRITFRVNRRFRFRFRTATPAQVSRVHPITVGRNEINRRTHGARKAHPPTAQSSIDVAVKRSRERGRVRGVHRTSTPIPGGGGEGNIYGPQFSFFRSTKTR